MIAIKDHSHYNHLNMSRKWKHDIEQICQGSLETNIFYSGHVFPNTQGSLSQELLLTSHTYTYLQLAYQQPQV